MRIEKNTSETAHVNERQVSPRVKGTADLTNELSNAIPTFGKGNSLLGRVSQNSEENNLFKLK